MELELLIYETNSLKEKRAVLKSLIERLKARFNISIAEVDQLDIWRRAVIGISMLSRDRAYLEAEMARLENFIENDHRLEILKLDIEYI